MKRKMLALAALCAAVSVSAQTSQQFDDLKRQVDALQREVQSLKSGSSAPSQPAGQGGGVWVKMKDANLRIYGFLETEGDFDTTESYFEAPTNTLVPRRTLDKITGSGDTQELGINYAGQHGRETFSARDSRFGFDLTLPKTEYGLAGEGIFEFDFNGNDSPATQPGAAPGVQGEANYFNFGALRVRHAYMDLGCKELDVKLGQTWSPFAWMPYNVSPEVTLPPTVGKPENRLAQLRLTHTHVFNDFWQTETMAAATRPPAANAAQAEYVYGVRASVPGRKAYLPALAGGSMIGLSAGWSGAAVPVRTIIGSALGDAQAYDVFVPVVPSKDGKDRANTAGVGAEFVNGNGVGVTEYPNLNLGVPGITAAQGGTFVDQGIAGINQAGNLELLHVRSWRAWGAASLGSRVAVSAGYSEVAGRNVDRFAQTAAAPATWTAANNGVAPRLQYVFACVMVDPASWLRLSAEWAQTRDTYNDPDNRFAVNNRLQLAAFLSF